MMVIESVKKYKWAAIIMCVAIGGGIFLYLRTSRQSGAEKLFQNTVVINNGAISGVDSNQDQAGAENNAPAESVEPENKNDSAPEPVKAEEDNNSKSEAKNNPVAVSEKESEKNEVFGVKNKLVSWGYQKSSGRKIDTIIIHSTYNALGGDPFSLAKIIDIYKSYGVAPHYIIDRAGGIYRLVEEKNIAYHAGESKVPDGRSDVNDFSIGIEMINSKTEKCTAAQYKSLNNLLSLLKNKYKIKYVLGHNQIAPGRKDDPWNFNWGKI